MLYFGVHRKPFQPPVSCLVLLPTDVFVTVPCSGTAFTSGDDLDSEGSSMSGKRSVQMPGKCRECRHQSACDVIPFLYVLYMGSLADPGFFLNPDPKTTSPGSGFRFGSGFWDWLIILG